MNWNFQTYLRLFLLFGGIAFLLFGDVSGDYVRIGIGVIAVIFGSIGLAYEWRETANSNE